MPAALTQTEAVGALVPNSIRQLTSGMMELSTAAEIAGAGGDTAVTSNQIQIYDNGSVPANIPAGVALVFERES